MPMSRCISSRLQLENGWHSGSAFARSLSYMLMTEAKQGQKKVSFACNIIITDTLSITEFNILPILNSVNSCICSKFYYLKKTLFYHFLRFNEEKIHINTAVKVSQNGCVNSRLLIRNLVIHVKYHMLLFLFTESN